MYKHLHVVWLSWIPEWFVRLPLLLIINNPPYADNIFHYIFHKVDGLPLYFFMSDISWLLILQSVSLLPESCVIASVVCCFISMHWYLRIPCLASIYIVGLFVFVYFLSMCQIIGYLSKRILASSPMRLWFSFFT